MQEDFWSLWLSSVDALQISCGHSYLLLTSCDPSSHSSQTAHEDVESFLGFNITGSESNLEQPRWEPIVWITYYDEAEQEMPEEYSILQEKLGASPICLMADITGRGLGIQEATAFCSLLLERFGGYAMDDYSEHLWTLDELRNNAGPNGRRFFIH